MLLVNVLPPLAAGEKLAPEAFDKMLDQTSEVKHRLAAKLQQAPGRNRSQKTPARGSGDSHFFAEECTERGSRVKGLRSAPINAKDARR